MQISFQESDITWLQEELLKDQPSPDCYLVFQRVVNEFRKLQLQNRLGRIVEPSAAPQKSKIQPKPTPKPQKTDLFQDIQVQYDDLSDDIADRFSKALASYGYCLQMLDGKNETSTYYRISKITVIPHANDSSTIVEISYDETDPSAKFVEGLKRCGLRIELLTSEEDDDTALIYRLFKP